MVDPEDMTLTGDGGDELFAGYGRYVQFAEQQELLPLNRKKIKSFLYPFINPIDPYKFPNNVAFWEGKSLRNLMEYIRIVPFELRKRLWKPDYAQYLQYTPPLFASTYAAAQHLSPTNLFQQVDINTYLPLDILTKVDVASMMHSLEVRPPIIDVRVAETAARIPTAFNLAKVNGKYEGKILLKKLLNRHFSHDFVYREKKGFAVPLEFWFGQKGNHQAYLREKLLSQDSMLKEIFNQHTIEKMLPHRHFSYSIWALLILEEWLRQNR